MSLELPVRSDFKAFLISLDFEGTTFEMGFDFNARLDRWVMQLRDIDGNILLAGVPILTEVDLNAQYPLEGLPPGLFVAIDETLQGRNAGTDDLGNGVKLLYLPSDEEPVSVAS